jgi:hypothetical protein
MLHCSTLSLHQCLLGSFQVKRYSENLFAAQRAYGYVFVDSPFASAVVGPYLAPDDQYISVRLYANTTQRSADTALGIAGYGEPPPHSGVCVARLADSVSHLRAIRAHSAGPTSGFHRLPASGAADQ